MSTTHTVVRGDTLTSIAKKFGTTVSELVNLNGITDPNHIVTGQVLTISGPSTAPGPNTSNVVNVHMFGLQSNTDNTLYASWIWDKENTKEYEVKWYYDTGDELEWFIGNESTVQHRQCTYSIPSNAKRVRFVVRPISTTHLVNKVETAYWTAEWSTEKIYNVSDNPPKVPPVPKVTIENYKLTATLDNLDVNAEEIEFYIIKDNANLFKQARAKIVTYHAAYSCNISLGYEYKVRCRSCRGSLVSDWSQYSENMSTIPGMVQEITTCRAASETSVYLEWPASSTATSYDVEYATSKEYFDRTNQTTVESGIEHDYIEITGLESGQQYFFRVRATNGQGSSEWSDVASVAIGGKPSAPTTYSSTTTVVSGESLYLYWVHNAEDGSSETMAELAICVDGDWSINTIFKSTAEEEKDKVSFYEIDTSIYFEGTVIEWRVRTAGVTGEYGEWSIQRTVDVYAPPTLQLSATDAYGAELEILSSLPIKVHALAGPSSQRPISYHLSVLSNQAYETVDNLGIVKMVNKNDVIYSKHFDQATPLVVDLSANSLRLSNNVIYTIECVVSMNSGLTASASRSFKVAWTDKEYAPNAEIGIDHASLTASIKPYCEDEFHLPIKDVVLSVYRREFDGTFTELMTNIENGSDVFITDPHPALDYARYRIVATSKTVGTVSYTDLAGIPIGEKSLVIQWDEDWRNLDAPTDGAQIAPAWSGSMIKLPYNIDISSNYSPDVEFIEYIGNAHPVSYYGTQLGESASWSTDIDKTNTEMIFALRRLAKWLGNVYVRDPSGRGYWANITVSFSENHGAVTIPVSFEITRVEGGV